MRRSSKTITYSIVLFLIFIGLFIGLKQLVLRTWVTSAHKYIHYPSLQPIIQRTIAVRFDPSFYYNGERPERLAEQLAERWASSGINLVFYRAYDPYFGAFYRTRYEYNREGEYGKYNLLKYILRESHARNIRVFGWLPVMNHHGAWEAHPEWRAKTASGNDFSDKGLEFPICTRSTESRTWWYNFVRDFLNNYPGIDGIDFAEPVVAWQNGDACWCKSCIEAFEKLGAEMTSDEIRAQPLTSLLKESIAITHRAGKQASVTFLVTADSSGEIFNLEQMRNLTGFDLASLLHAEDNEMPDIICPEFLWQELKSRYLEADASSPLFSPEWTGQAFRKFLREIDIPIEVVIHLEITDFPGVKVDAHAFKASLQSALQNDAFHIDVYSSNQLDRKDAWTALASIKDAVKKKKCLVLYNPESNRSDAIQTGELLRHFNIEITLQSLSAYAPGVIHEYDNVFYIGTEWGTRIPASLIDDLLHLETSFCWLGFNIEIPLSNELLSNKLGIQYLTTVKDQYHSVSYKNMSLKKEDPWMNVVRVFEEKRCKVLATASNGAQQVPYAVRSGRHFWYVADVPTSYAIEGGRFLVFADLLHDILNENHAERRLAMVRIEDVHPLTDPKTLKKIANYLRSQNVPFQVAFVPYYVFPEENTYVKMGEKPEFVSALKHMVKKGGTLVLHGITHQRFGETTTDYEFWDPLSDSPIEGQTDSEIRQRVERGLRECWSNGIYPLIWETPHYAGSQNLYSVISDLFSLSMERRQAIDERDTDQFLPYAIFSDRFGQIILPENLGYVPLNNPKADVIIEPAKNMKAVRDGVASFFFHPSVDIHVLKSIVRFMKKDQYSFTNIAGLPVRVKTSLGILTNQPGTIRLSANNFSGQENRLIFPGIVRSHQEVEPGSGGDFSKEIELRNGELYAIHFIRQQDEIHMAQTEKKDSAKPEVLQVLQNVSNQMGERNQVPIPLLIEDASATGGLRNEIRSFEAIFTLAGVELQKKDVREFSEIAPEFNLLILPSAAGALLNSNQIEIIIDAVRNGDISLIASGFTLIIDELGIEKMPGQVEVHSVVDTLYPNVEITWNKSDSVPFFESPGDAAFIYTDQETEAPLVFTSSLGNGKYIFLATPLDEESPVGSTRFPYFLFHLFRQLNFFPLVRGTNAEVFFNPGEREEIAIEDLVKFWRRSGIRIIHAAGWQIYPEWTYNYDRLIHLAHTNGMLVYAWLEPPYVHEKFWQEHPEWREKNALGEDAIVGWHKPMALGNSEILRAVLDEWRTLLERFNWDGVTIHRLGFESEGGEQDPETYTPFHPSVREKFHRESGFDPMELIDPASGYYWEKNPDALQKFRDFRSSLAQSYIESLLKMLSEIRKSGRDYWEVIITHEEQRSDSGIELEALLDFKQRYGTKLQLIPAAKNQWVIPGDEFDLVQLSISPSQSDSAFHPLAPTQYPTGIGLYNLLRKFINNSQRFTLFSEDSLYDIDTQMLPIILAPAASERWSKEGLFIKASLPGEIVFSDETLKSLAIDDAPAGSFYQNRMLLPVGEHNIFPSNNRKGFLNGLKSTARLVDCSADLLRCEIKWRGITVGYRTDKRAVFVINEKPISVYLDDKRIKVKPEKGFRGWAITLPSGQHSAMIVTRSKLNLILTSLSLALSNAIVAISIFAFAALVFIFTMSRLPARFRSKG